MTITVLPEDFDANYDEKWDGMAHAPQYTKNDDCPVARAIRRQEGVVARVGAEGRVTLPGPNVFIPQASTKWDSFKSIEVFRAKQPYDIIFCTLLISSR